MHQSFRHRCITGNLFILILLNLAFTIFVYDYPDRWGAILDNEGKDYLADVETGDIVGRQSSLTLVNSFAILRRDPTFAAMVVARAIWRKGVAIARDGAVFFVNRKIAKLQRYSPDLSVVATSDVAVDCSKVPKLYFDEKRGLLYSCRRDIRVFAVRL